MPGTALSETEPVDALFEFNDGLSDGIVVSFLMQGSKCQLVVLQRTYACSEKIDCGIRLLSLKFVLLLHEGSEVIV